MNILENKENSAVQAHINMLQGIINRMANNSANCKTWLITILAAILLLIADDKICSTKMWVCYIPIGLFLFLDCFYLGLERSFIKEQNDFIKKINKGEDITEELFIIKTKKIENCSHKNFILIQNFFDQLWNIIKAIFSFSIFPFYGFLIGIICFLAK